MSVKFEKVVPASANTTSDDFWQIDRSINLLMDISDVVVIWGGRKRKRKRKNTEYVMKNGWRFMLLFLLLLSLSLSLSLYRGINLQHSG